MMDIKEELLLWFINFLILFFKSASLSDKSVAGSGIINKIKQNKQLAEELHEPIIIKFEKRQVYLSSKDNISSSDLVDMLLISKFKKGICFLLCVISIFSKHVWVVFLKHRKDITMTKAFEKNITSILT